MTLQRRRPAATPPLAVGHGPPCKPRVGRAAASGPGSPADGAAAPSESGVAGDGLVDAVGDAVELRDGPLLGPGQP